jgi:hypothetical protein
MESCKADLLSGVLSVSLFILEWQELAMYIVDPRLYLSLSLAEVVGLEGVLFATKLVGPRVNIYFVSQSQVLFITCI